jgi:hypothetical protein
MLGVCCKANMEGCCSICAHFVGISESEKESEDRKGTPCRMATFTGIDEQIWRSDFLFDSTNCGTCVDIESKIANSSPETYQRAGKADVSASLLLLSSHSDHSPRFRGAVIPSSRLDLCAGDR